MAQLLDWLALAGARTSGGTSVASGKAWFYEPGGGTTLATIYSDVDGTVVATNPVTLDAGGRATVYVTSPVRVVVQDATGADISDVDQADVHRAEAVQVDNAGWTNSYLDDVLTKLYTSTGGTDAMYLESGGATARTIKAKFAELSISVKDFGAKGDGLTVDTTAVQAACNRCSFLGGGEVYFPPGTYKIDLAINVANKVSIRGSSRTGTIVQSTSGTANAFSFASSGGVSISGLYITNTGTSTGAGISLSSCNSYTVRDVSVDSFKYGVDITGATSYASVILGCFIDGQFGDNTFRGIHYNATGGTNGPHAVIGNDINPALGAGVELTGATSNVKFVGNHFLINGAKGILFNAALTGTFIYATGNSFQGATVAFDLSGLSTDPYFYQDCNGVEGYTTTVATGSAFTPNLANGPDIRINATTGAGTITVNAPTPTPSAIHRNARMITRHVNAAGGAVTWTMNAVFVLDAAAAIPTTDGHTIIVEWIYDVDSSKWREVGRTNTVT